MPRRGETCGLRVGSHARRDMEHAAARLKRKDSAGEKVWLRGVKKALAGLSKNATSNEAFGIVNLILDEDQVEKFLQRQHPRSEQSYSKLSAFLRDSRIFKPIFEEEWRRRTAIAGQIKTPKVALYTAVDESLTQIYANVSLALYRGHEAMLFPGFNREQIAKVGIQARLLSRFLLMPKLWAVPDRLTGE